MVFTLLSFIDIKLTFKIRDATALKCLLLNDSAGGLLVSIAFFLNLHLNFLNLRSLLVIQNNYQWYPIVLMTLGAPHSRTISVNHYF